MNANWNQLRESSFASKIRKLCVERQVNCMIMVNLCDKNLASVTEWFDGDNKKAKRWAEDSQRHWQGEVDKMKAIYKTQSAPFIIERFYSELKFLWNAQVHSYFKMHLGNDNVSMKRGCKHYLVFYNTWTAGLDNERYICDTSGELADKIRAFYLLKARYEKALATLITNRGDKNSDTFIYELQVDTFNSLHIATKRDDEQIMLDEFSLLMNDDKGLMCVELDHEFGFRGIM